MKPGVYDISMEEYLADPAVNQSTLKKMRQSAAHARYTIDHPEKTTDDMLMGQVLHTATFEPTLLSRYHVRPAQYPGLDKKKNEVMKPWNGNATWCEKWLEDHADKPVISDERFKRVMSMSQVVRNNPGFAKAVKAGGKFEQSLFCEHPSEKMASSPFWD